MSSTTSPKLLYTKPLDIPSSDLTLSIVNNTFIDSSFLNISVSDELGVFVSDSNTTLAVSTYFIETDFIFIEDQVEPSTDSDEKNPHRGYCDWCKYQTEKLIQGKGYSPRTNPLATNDGSAQVQTVAKKTNKPHNNSEPRIYASSVVLCTYCLSDLQQELRQETADLANKLISHNI